MLPSERTDTGTGICTASPPSVSATVATNGVGRNGSPAGTSASRMKRAASVAYLKCAAVSRASAGTVAVKRQLRAAFGATGATAQSPLAPVNPATAPLICTGASPRLAAITCTCTGWPATIRPSLATASSRTSAASTRACWNWVSFSASR